MSDLEAAFDFYWRALIGPDLDGEVKLCPERGWKFDRFHRNSGVIVEIEGGTWKPGGGRHNRAGGFSEDCVKYNWAQAHGYAVFRVTSDMLTNDPITHLSQIIATIEERLA